MFSTDATNILKGAGGECFSGRTQSSLKRCDSMDDTDCLTAIERNTQARTKELQLILHGIIRRNPKDVAQNLFAVFIQVLQNIISDPGNEKLRKFNVSKESFQQQIASVDGAFKLLEFLHYHREQSPAGKVCFVLSPSDTHPKQLGEYVAMLKSALNEIEHVLQSSPSYRIISPSSGPRASAVIQEQPNAINDQNTPSLTMSSTPNSAVQNNAQSSVSTFPVETPSSANGERDIRASDNRGNGGMIRGVKRQLSPAFKEAGNIAQADAEKYADGVALMVEMGFSVEQSHASLLKTHGDIERAAHYLLTGDERIFATPPRKRTGSQALIVRPECHDDVITLATELDKRDKEKQDTERRLQERADAELAQRMKEDAEKEELRKKDELTAIALHDYQQTRMLVQEDAKLGARLPLEIRNIQFLGDEYVFKKQFQCKVCYDDYEVAKICVLPCGHLLCLDCMRNYFVAQIEDGRAADMKCFDPECHRHVQYVDAEPVIMHDAKLLEKYQKFLLDNHLKSDPDVRYCPKPECNVAMIGDRSTPMMVCPKCKYRFCFNCFTDEWHEGSSCHNYQKWKKENNEGDTRFETWCNKHTKFCPKCKYRIEKNGGCDHMTCANCRYEFHWVSGEKWKGYAAT